MNDAHRKYTVEFCDREYNARAAIPDHPQIFARWSEQAAASRRLRACLVDLAYGDRGAERLDYFSTREDDVPLLVFIHGGFWRSLDKSDFSWIAPPFVQQGVAVALTNYGLAPRARIEDMVRQSLGALAWLYRNAGRLGFDRNRIFVGGHSAGGHLAAMMMAALWPQFDADLPRNLVKGALAVSGIFDLEPLLHAPFVNVDLKLDTARARRLSPALMPPATDAPLVLGVGGLESGEFQRQTQLLAARWKNNLVRSVPAPGSNHLTVCDEIADPASALFDAALALVKGEG